MDQQPWSAFSAVLGIFPVVRASLSISTNRANEMVSSRCPSAHRHFPSVPPLVVQALRKVSSTFVGYW